MGCLCDYVGITAGLPQIAADLLHRLSPHGRANTTPPNTCETDLERFAQEGR